VRESALASRVSGSIHFDDDVLLTEAIPQAARAAKGGSSLQEILEKLDA
jgi:hypothetical protein